MDNRIYELEETNREQREEIDNLNNIIQKLQNADLEKTRSIRNIFKQIVKVCNSNNMYKNMEILDIAEKTESELTQDINDMLFVPNDEKIIVLSHNRQSIR